MPPKIKSVKEKKKKNHPTPLQKFFSQKITSWGDIAAKEDSSEEESSTREEKSLQFVQNWVESLSKFPELFKLYNQPL